MRFRSIAVVGVFLTIMACASFGVAKERRPDRPTRVLFIGNSYTYFNNLPEMFTKLAEAAQRAVETRMVAPGGWRLKDHWLKGEALKTLREGGWHYVVLQDQSTLGINYYLEGKPHVTSDAIFKPYAQQWAAEIRHARATAVFYLTWARKATPEDQAALNYAYIHAARKGRAVIAPVGITWAQVREKHPAIELFQKDGSHPSPAGSYLAACALYATIFDRSPVGLPARITGIPVNLQTAMPEPESKVLLVDLPLDQARILQSASSATWQQLKRMRGYPKVSPVRDPTVAPLPPGEPLSASNLEGTWRGSILFYPVGPVEMVLQLRFDGVVWKGQLELKYQSKNFQDESFDLADVHAGDRELAFTDPNSVGVDNLTVQFRGVSPRVNELRGTAETTRDAPDWPLRILGTWQLHREKP